MNFYEIIMFKNTKYEIKKNVVNGVEKAIDLKITHVIAVEESRFLHFLGLICYYS